MVCEMERQGERESATGGLGSLRALGSELSALMRVVGTLPWRSLGCDTLDQTDLHPVPVVFVHGLFGDPTNFVALRRHLTRHGVRRFSSFTYGPRVDYQRLASALHEHLVAVCDAADTSRVDVVGHSLGGLVARYLVQTSGGGLVRRLVTLGTPYLAATNPEQELAIFARHDVLVPPPSDRIPRRLQVVDACGHLGLLTEAASLGAVVGYLTRTALFRRRVNPVVRLDAAAAR